MSRQLDKCCQKSHQINDDVREEPPIEDSLHQPRANCRVHFSGGVIAGTSNLSTGISQIYKLDEISEYVGAGEYTDNTKAFPKAVRTTFDGIAIDSGTHLIIYSKKNFQGTIVLDVYGPKIINNQKWRYDERYASEIRKTFPEPLESNYPKTKRIWSKGDMWEWSYGSCKIMCGN